MTAMATEFLSPTNDWLAKFDEPISLKKAPKKEIVSVSQLQGRSKLVCLHYQRLFHHHISRTSRISGRSLEMIFSKLSKTRYGYYISHDHQGQIQCFHEWSDEAELFFDIGASYQCRLAMLGKGYFDTFQRGTIVQLDQTPVSICSLFFDRWCLDFGLFDMMNELHAVGNTVRVPVHRKTNATTYKKLMSKNRTSSSSTVKILPLVIETRRPSFMDEE